jgi:hypothetical protein
VPVAIAAIKHQRPGLNVVEEGVQHPGTQPVLNQIRGLSQDPRWQAVLLGLDRLARSGGSKCDRPKSRSGSLALPGLPHCYQIERPVPAQRRRRIPG